MPRLFVSVDPPPEFEPRVRDVQAELRATNADITYPKPEQAHLTLKFVGLVEEYEVDEVKDAVDDAVEGFEPFSLRLEGSGVFPSPEYIRVVWIGVHDSTGRLRELAERLEDKTVGRGLADSREHPFEPHLTVGRMTSGRGKSEVREFVERHRDLDLGEFTVEHVKLKQSTLDAGGSVHDTLHVAEL
ncbi:MAG: RNA 2',3'-cyclic phosphodiesterase [Halobacteriales archaeon]